MEASDPCQKNQPIGTDAGSGSHVAGRSTPEIVPPRCSDVPSRASASKRLEPDDHLLKEARSGDRDALTQLLSRYGPEVRRGLSINAHWRSVLEEDDIMQVTYFEAFQRIGSFRSGARAFPTWLRRIAQNNLRDAVAWLDRDKRPSPQRRLTALPGQDPVLWLYELIQETGTTPSGRVASKEARHLLEQEIAALPVTYRRVLELLYFQEKPVHDVAAELQRTCGAVHLLRIRAIDRLRERLGSASRFV